MANPTANGRRKKVELGDQEIMGGEGGETHQTEGTNVPPLTTQQGVPVADDQNSPRIGVRGTAALEDFHFREKLFHFDQACRSFWERHIGHSNESARTN